MRKISLILVFLTLFSFLVIPNQKILAAENNITQERQSYLLKSGNFSLTEKALRDLGITDFERTDELKVYEMSLTEDEKIALSKEPSILYIEKNQKIRISEIPNDPSFSLQTYLQNSNIVNAWNTTTGSPSITVAVVDTGVNYNHEDLKNIMWTNASGYHGYDVVNSDNDPMDDNLHGTGIAGVIAAQRNNGIGIAGIANVKIMAVKAVPASGEGDVIDLAKGLTWAADNGAKVINVSLGLLEESSTLDNAVAYAKNKGSLIVAATGNNRRALVDNPARNPSVIGVGALDANGYKAIYANYGDGIGLVALGDNIYTTSWNIGNQVNHYQYLSGTSFATPQVTATAALLLSKDPSLTPDQLKKRILSSAKKIPYMAGATYTLYFGYGKLDTYNALTYDKTAPSLNISSFYRAGNGIYEINGQAIDDTNGTEVLPSITNSNIASVRYQIDNNGYWYTLNSTSVPSFNLGIKTNSLGTGDHMLTFEVYDTSGNKLVKTLNTRDASALPNTVISQNPSDYKYQLVNQSPYPNIAAGQKSDMTISYLNIGKSVWTKQKVHLATTKPMDRNSIFADSSWLSTNRVAMVEDIVAPGEIAHFNFTFTAPAGLKGQFNEYFNLVAEGIGWMNDIGLYWKVNVEAQAYHAKFLNQSPYITLNKGEQAVLWVDYQNTGSITWDSSTVKLGTSNPLDRNSVFYNPASGSGWLSSNRIGMSQTTVAPGSNVRFNFAIKAPNTAGSYNEYFRPVADGVSWLENNGLYWNIVVK